MPWHLPSEVNHTTGQATGEHHIDSPQAEERFQRWKGREGCIGFPWIDDLMRQLWQEGWVHHLGRHAVAAWRMPHQLGAWRRRVSEAHF